MKTINIDTKTKSYPIIIADSFEPLSAVLKEKKYSKIGIISDSNVFPLYGAKLKEVCLQSNEHVHTYVFEAGEESKNLTTMEEMYRFCLRAKLDRQSVLLALGGGVTGDMTGFLAATFMRGIDYIQVPTSLLAQVDSSVGGKTGIDFDEYKNLVGAFYQPECVFMNTSTLKTLPKREFSSGMGEVIKHGCILDKSYLNKLVNDAEIIQNLNHFALTNMITRSCEIKRDIVNQDEKEHGVRALLNFGHTFGHAIERKLYKTHSHGACVAIGMVSAAYLSRLLGYISNSDFKLVENTIKSYGLPVQITDLSAKEIYEDMFLDKKTAHNTLNLVLLKSLGHAFITSEITKEDILDAIYYIIKN